MNIGTRVYLVHNSFDGKKNKHGAKIILAKVKTFENRNGEVVPVFHVGKFEYDTRHYVHFIDINQAITFIS